MKTSFNTFSSGIDDLAAFLSNADREMALVASLLDDKRQEKLTDEEKLLLGHIREAGTAKRQYVYAIGIVGLYGLLERFVDSIIEKYVYITAFLTRQYVELPESIRKNHVPLSMDLIKAIGEDRYREGMTVEKIVANLHSCLCGDVAFQLNTSAFVLHRGNIKLSKIQDFLRNVGIDPSSRRFLVMPSLAQWFKDADPSRDTRLLKDEELGPLLMPVDDLVDRRNAIAHGTIDDIETVDLLNNRCNFIKAFAASIVEILQQEILRLETVGGSAQSFGQPIKVFDNRIVCFERSEGKISVGDRLVAITGDSLTPYRWSQIASLEVNNASTHSLEITENTRFAAAVNFRASDSYTYFVLPPELELHKA